LLARISVKARLVLLSAVLLAILFGVSALLSRSLNNSAEALADEARYVEVLRTASAAQKAFGDVKYWLTDLAVSLLNLSEQRAQEARTRFETELDALEPIDPEAIATIRHELDRVVARSLEAVEAYTEDRRVIGNSTMAQARVHVIAVDERLSQLVDRLGDEAAAASAAARQDSAQAVRTSWIIILSASALALALTALVLRSIVVPLGQITGAIRALTAGRTDVEMPDAGRHEIGAIANTLALFRDGLIERNRLAAEREQAMVNLQIARDEATRSSGVLRVTFDHMAQGVAMFDAGHNLVAWNRQFGDLLGLPDECSTLRRPTPASSASWRSAAISAPAIRKPPAGAPVEPRPAFRGGADAGRRHGAGVSAQPGAGRRLRPHVLRHHGSQKRGAVRARRTGDQPRGGPRPGGRGQPHQERVPRQHEP
jgi:adenylate cyclase